VARVNDCLLILDEMGEARPDVVDQIIYMIGNGTGKARMRQDASLRNNYTWRTLFLSTGEVKAEDKIRQAGKASTEGIGVRLANIPALTGTRHGVFDTIHDMRTSAELASHLGRAAKKYHGTAIIAFLTEFLAERENNLWLIHSMIEQFMKPYASYGGQIGRVVERFALAAAAGEMATVWGIVPWATGEATRSATACMDAWLEDREATGDERVIEMLRKYIGANQFSRFVLCGKDKISSVIHDVAGFRMVVQGERMDYFVLCDQMDKVLPGIGATRAAQAIDNAGFLIREKGRTTLKSRLRPLVDNMRAEVLVYHVSGEILGD